MRLMRSDDIEEDGKGGATQHSSCIECLLVVAEQEEADKNKRGNAEQVTGKFYRRGVLFELSHLLDLWSDQLFTNHSSERVVTLQVSCQFFWGLLHFP